MAMKNPQASLEKFKRRAQQAGPDFKAGVERVTESPTAKAAARADAMLAGVTEAVTSGRWASALAAVPLQDWKAQTAGKGAQNYATGVAQLSPSAEGRMRQNYEAVNAIASEVRQMPDETFEDRVARAVAMIRGARELRRRRT